MVSDYCGKNVELYCDEATFEFILHMDFILRFVDPVDKLSFWLEIFTLLQSDDNGCFFHILLTFKGMHTASLCSSKLFERNPLFP
jgi:hypothetical protein